LKEKKIQKKTIYLQLKNNKKKKKVMYLHIYKIENL
jgi:hypothetical protein